MKNKYTPPPTLITKAKTSVVPLKHLINNKTDLANVGTILLHQQTIQAIRDNSGPLAPSCEYQTHFWALVCRLSLPDKSNFDIAIPTVFFNYKQEVSGARIDFELQDVCDMSDNLEPVHNVMVNKFMSSDFIKQLPELFPSYDITYLSAPMNSLHKHP